MNSIKLMEKVSQTTDMGRESISQVLERVSDAELKEVLQRQKQEYDSIFEDAAVYMKDQGHAPKEACACAKIQSQFMTSIKTMTSDDPTSKIAEMVIQGSTMGITEITKAVNDYSGEEKEPLHLAKKLLKTEKANVEEMKKFL